MQQRYYDPLIGHHFLSADPATAFSPVGAFNQYWYANANPYRVVDPDGRNGVAALGGLVQETWNSMNGHEFDGDMVLGALKDVWRQTFEGV